MSVQGGLIRCPIDQIGKRIEARAAIERIRKSDIPKESFGLRMIPDAPVSGPVVRTIRQPAMKKARRVVCAEPWSLVSSV